MATVRLTQAVQWHASPVSPPVLHLVRAAGMPILQQLRMEEALLRGDARNWCILNSGSAPPQVVMGLSGRPVRLLNMDRVHRDKIPIIKRFSGGGTVVVDQGTLYASLLMNEADVHGVPPYPRDIMSWTEEQVYAPVFNDALRVQPSFKLLGHDYVLGDKKIGGNAQAITRDRWLHHTSFLWDFNPANMEYLLIPESQPEYRAHRDHTDFLTTLKQHVATPAEFWVALMQRLQALYTVVDVPLAEAITAANDARQGQRHTNKLLELIPVDTTVDMGADSDSAAVHAGGSAPGAGVNRNETVQVLTDEAQGGPGFNVRLTPAALQGDIHAH